MSHQRLTMQISGKVQGVGYRASAAEKANSLGVTGYARNLPDGRVEIVAEGSPASLVSLKQWCRDGPPAAVVDIINTTEDSATDEFDNFGVR